MGGQKDGVVRDCGGCPSALEKQSRSGARPSPGASIRQPMSAQFRERKSGDRICSGCELRACPHSGWARPRMAALVQRAVGTLASSDMMGKRPAPYQLSAAQPQPNARGVTVALVSGMPLCRAALKRATSSPTGGDASRTSGRTVRRQESRTTR